MQETLIEKIDYRIKQFNRLKEDGHIFAAAVLLEAALKDGKKILVFGNGGSATQAAHFAAELVNKFYCERPALPAIALADSMANITSIANDSDFKYIFSRQVEAIGKEGDAAIGISTGGKSANVLKALKVSRDLKLKTIMLCGESSKAGEELGLDIVISINSSDTPTIQEMHLFILHIFAEIVEKKLFPAPEL
jgi:D-sedoheptulose 7-phosphate isomerase